MPDSHKWMYRASYRVALVTRNGIRITVGSGKYQTHYTYSNPECLEVQRGRRVVAFWNDYDPDTDCVVYTLKNGKPDHFICVASRVSDVPRLGATAEQMTAEASRKKLSQQIVRSQRVSLAPYLTRTARVQVIPADKSEVNERIVAAKTEQTVRTRSRATVRKFTGDASELLGASSQPVEAFDPTMPAEEDMDARALLGDCNPDTAQKGSTEQAGKIVYHLNKK
jgi:hypothetical protein